MATVIECSKIMPPADSPPEFSIPIVFFDMAWYDFIATQMVFFFDFPCSKSHFIHTIVPDLKKSLSLTLTHFFPLAGKIIHPLNAGDKPILLYKSGDSVCFTVSESRADFHHLTWNHPRESSEFYGYAPELPPATRSEKSISCPVLALQVTLFPGKGLGIGFVTHHVVVDAGTFSLFIQAWTLISRTRVDGADNVLARLRLCNYLPFFNRKTVRNLGGLDSLFWERILKFNSAVEPLPVKFPTNKVRATFVLKEDEIRKLRNLILDKCPNVAHLSSFTVVCALVWVCSARSAEPGGEEVADDEAEHFGFSVDCRGRLEPPLPANYFGNCLALVKTVLKHGVVKGPDGLVMAAVAIGKAIKEDVYNEKGILHDAENWQLNRKMFRKRQYGVWGSTKVDFYEADYGWGKPNKLEGLFTDGDGVIRIFLSKSRYFEGGLEIGLSKTKVQMDAFTRIFAEFLIDMLQ